MAVKEGLHAGTMGLAVDDSRAALEQADRRSDRMKYNPALDGIRAFAIGGVVLFHAFPQWIPGGWIGVDVFFALSGYLITGLLVQEIDNHHRLDLPRFYARRFLRLAPALFCLLAFALFKAFESPLRHQQLLSVAIAFVYMMNWNRAFGWVAPGILSHTWSLAVEEQFYILWPLTLRVVRPLKPRIWVFGLILAIVGWRCFLASSGATSERLYMGFDTHADSLMIGCFLALSPITFAFARLAQTTVIIPVGVLLSCLGTLDHQAEFVKTFGFDVAPACTAWIIIASREKSWIRSVLTLKPFIYTGKISYGWYLWHYPVLIMVSNAFAKHHISQDLVAGVSGLVVSYGVAVGSYNLVEKPFLRLKQKLHPPAENEFVGEPKDRAINQPVDDWSAPLLPADGAESWPAS